MINQYQNNKGELTMKIVIELGLHQQYIKLGKLEVFLSSNSELQHPKVISWGIKPNQSLLLKLRPMLVSTYNAQRKLA